MSEYQYYEFRAIDRPLTDRERAELRAKSTRAEITATSFTNVYHWGDFRGDPNVLMDRYFDAFVYVANWGTNRLMFRIPRGLVDVEAVSEYCDGEVLSLKAKKEHVVLEFLSSPEEPDDEWSDGEEWMPSLISLRSDLMRGDLRALYIAWLASIPPSSWDDEEFEDDDRLEPPVPAGLAKLTGPLRSLADFLRVEDELIEVAASSSTGDAPSGPSRADLARWVKGLPIEEKNDYLVRFLADESDLALRAEVTHRFREATAPRGSRVASQTPRRTVSQLLSARDALIAVKSRKAAEKAAADKARREKEQAAARAKHLDDLARREPHAWDEVEALIATKKPKEYDLAIQLLVDLRDLAGRSGRLSQAEARIRELRQRHAKKPSLIERMDRKNLGK